MKDIYEKGSRYWWLNEESQKMLDGGYLCKNETVKMAIERIAESTSKEMSHIPNFKEKVIEIVEKGWSSLSSPVWSNTGTKRGLPISCYGVYVSDNIDSIADKLSEVIRQSSYGGGTSAYFGGLRGRNEPISSNGGTSTGAVSMQLPYDAVTRTFSQGETRGSSFASYLDMDHKDFDEQMNIRSVNSPIQKIMFGVCAEDEFLEKVEARDPEALRRWALVHKSRKEKGMPFIIYTGNSNKNKPLIYRILEERIHASNLCTEIFLPSSEEESFVCCLSSLNLALYDEWKDTDTVEIMTCFLDAIMTEFIKKSKGVKHLAPARRFAKRHRALGLGILGWHSYLQSKMIPFDSLQANSITTEIFSTIEKRSKEASYELGKVLGYAPIFSEIDCEKHGVIPSRNTTNNATAPTKSSSAILGQVSEGRNPYHGCYYKVGSAKGTFMRKNPYFEKLLVSKGMDNKDVWKSVMLANGSCQHLDFLSQEEKEVFKTFSEINQMSIMIQASIAQKYIDQGQSIDINIPSTIATKEVNKLYMEAWKLGIKSLYYQKSESVAKEFINSVMDCHFCES